MAFVLRPIPTSLPPSPPASSASLPHQLALTFWTVTSHGFGTWACPTNQPTPPSPPASSVSPPKLRLVSTPSLSVSFLLPLFNRNPNPCPFHSNLTPSTATSTYHAYAPNSSYNTCIHSTVKHPKCQSGEEDSVLFYFLFYFLTLVVTSTTYWILRLT